MAGAEKMDSTLTDKQRSELDQFQPMWKIVAGQFFAHRAAVAGLAVILIFLFIAIFAPVISQLTGLDPDEQNPLSRYAPVNARTSIGTFQRDEKVLEFKEKNPELATEAETEILSKNLFTPTAPTEVLKEIAALEPVDTRPILQSLSTPGGQKLRLLFDNFETYHLLGTDELGRDVFIRLVYGTRVSMGVGILVAISASLVGLLIGSLAGYYGGVVDTVLMRFTDSLLSLPILPVQIVIAAIDINKIPFLGEMVSASNQSMYKLIIILVLFSWMTVALLVRGSILSLREREFILASKTLGATDATIIFRHMFPNVIAPMLVSITLGVGESILWEAALSFLGLGIQQPTPSWGNMLTNAQELITEAPFLAILPGLLILATTISFNYLGDGLQDAIDPKAIRR